MCSRNRWIAPRMCFYLVPLKSFWCGVVCPNALQHYHATFSKRSLRRKSLAHIVQTKAAECDPQNATFSCPICLGYTRTFIVPSRHLLPHFAGSEVGVASAQIMSALMPASVDGPSLRPLLTRSTSLPPQMYSTLSSNTQQAIALKSTPSPMLISYPQNYPYLVWWV